MKTKKIFISIFVLTLVSLFGIRVYHVNKDVELPQVKTYEKGETVGYEDDYLDKPNDDAKGYTFMVLDSEYFTKEEFYKKYNISKNEFNDNKLTEYYVTVKVRVTNTNDTQEDGKGVVLKPIFLKGVNYYTIIDDEMFLALNPTMPAIGFSLKPHASKEMVLTYPIIKSSHTDMNGLKKHPPKLQLTEYPTQKLLKIV